jgi:hypothetical protein
MNKLKAFVKKTQVSGSNYNWFAHLFNCKKFA